VAERLKNRAEIIEALERIDYRLRYESVDTWFPEVRRDMDALLETFKREKKKPKGGCKG
jgi:hypothetical protein